MKLLALATVLLCSVSPLFAAAPTLEVTVPDNLQPNVMNFIDVNTDASTDRISVVLATEVGSARYFKNDKVLVFALPQGVYTVVATASNAEGQITKVVKVPVGSPSPTPVPPTPGPTDSLTQLIRTGVASVVDPDKTRLSYAIGQTFITQAASYDPANPQAMIDATMVANQTITAKAEWQNKVFTPLEQYLDALMIQSPDTDLKAVWLKIGVAFQASQTARMF